jgi:hypothetical protein
MKKDYVRADMKADQLKTMSQQLAKPDKPVTYFPLLLIMADVIDDAVKGANTYMTLGVSRDKSSIILTISVDGHKLYASGATLAELADRVNNLL